MNKAYKRINWENYPSDATPLNEANLNKLDSAMDILDDRTITLETTKATKTEVATLVADVTFEESTGIITITKKNGSKVTIDTQMEKIAVNFDYNPTTQKIVLTLIDGTKQYIDLSALITQYEFLDTDTVAFIIGTDGKVSAIVKEGSIEEKHLEPNYLAKIKVESAKAQSSQESAATSATKAASSAATAESYATGGTGTRDGEDADNAKYYSEQAKNAYEKLKDGNVTGIKGNAESSYRTGNVNITPANIGLGNVDNTADKDKSVKSATTADKLSTSAGSSTRPVYFKDGKPVLIDYTLAAAASTAAMSSNVSIGAASTWKRLTLSKFHWDYQKTPLFSIKDGGVYLSKAGIYFFSATVNLQNFTANANVHVRIVTDAGNIIQQASVRPHSTASFSVSVNGVVKCLGEAHTVYLEVVNYSDATGTVIASDVLTAIDIACLILI